MHLYVKYGMRINLEKNIGLRIRGISSGSQAVYVIAIVYVTRKAVCSVCLFNCHRDNVRICTFIPVEIAIHIDRLTDLKSFDSFVDFRARL